MLMNTALLLLPDFALILLGTAIRRWMHLGDHFWTGVEKLVYFILFPALLINATRKWDYTPVSLPRRDFMEHARTMWEKLGLPALHPRQPWYGYNLGAWEDENEQEARLAVEGRYYETGAKLRARGVIG